MKRHTKQLRRIAILTHFLKAKCKKITFDLWFNWFIYSIDCYVIENNIVAVSKKCNVKNYISNAVTPKELIDLIMKGE